MTCAGWAELSQLSLLCVHDLVSGFKVSPAEPRYHSTRRCNFIFRMLHASGRQLIGFDLNEVSAGDFRGDNIDAIVGARILFKLCNYMVA